MGLLGAAFYKTASALIFGIGKAVMDLSINLLSLSSYVKVVPVGKWKLQAVLPEPPIFDISATAITY